MGKKTQKKIFNAYTAGITIASIFLAGCSYKTGCYKPDQKQKYEHEICYKYTTLISKNTRFVYMDDILWMQNEYGHVIEARDFNITVNDENETHTVSKYTVLPSDHPLQKFSNLLINVDFLKNYDKITALSYEPINEGDEIIKERLSGTDTYALNKMLNDIRAEQNQTASLKKEEINSTK